MTSLADDSDDEWQRTELHMWYMIIFIGSALAISIIGVMKVLTINFTFYFLLDLISMSTTYPHILLTMVDLFLS